MLYDSTGTPPCWVGGFHLMVIWVFDAETKIGDAGASGTTAASILTEADGKDCPW